MAAFQNTREETEQRVMVHLLSEIERNSTFTQRGLADDLGIALGLMNQYLKRCVTKGWVRISQVSPRRISYFLTPDGFREKSLMVKEYLARSMIFFKDARQQCENIFSFCQEQEWQKIALSGHGDLSDIARLVAMGTGISVTILEENENFEDYDAVLITDLVNPQEAYDSLKEKIHPSRLLTLELLHISRGRK